MSHPLPTALRQSLAVGTIFAVLIVLSAACSVTPATSTATPSLGNRSLGISLDDAQAPFLASGDFVFTSSISEVLFSGGQSEPVPVTQGKYNGPLLEQYSSVPPYGIAQVRFYGPPNNLTTAHFFGDKPDINIEFKEYMETLITVTAARHWPGAIDWFRQSFDDLYANPNQDEATGRHGCISLSLRKANLTELTLNISSIDGGCPNLSDASPQPLPPTSTPTPPPTPYPWTIEELVNCEEIPGDEMSDCEVALFTAQLETVVTIEERLPPTEQAIIQSYLDKYTAIDETLNQLYEDLAFDVGEVIYLCSVAPQWKTVLQDGLDYLAALGRDDLIGIEVDFRRLQKFINETNDLCEE